MPDIGVKEFHTFVADTPVIVVYTGRQVLGVFTKEDNRPIHLQPEEVRKLASMLPAEA